MWNTDAANFAGNKSPAFGLKQGFPVSEFRVDRLPLRAFTGTGNWKPMKKFQSILNFFLGLRSFYG